MRLLWCGYQFFFWKVRDQTLCPAPKGSGTPHVTPATGKCRRYHLWSVSDLVLVRSFLPTVVYP